MTIGRVILMALVAVVLGVSLAAFRPSKDGNVSGTAASPEIIETRRSLHVFDISPIRSEVYLFSKSWTGDLWFRDAMGRERCLASNVVRASFSPDGQKFAYGTGDNEILIFTIYGDQIARLRRAADHAWLANSVALTFTATPSVNYPELEHTVIYYLRTNPPASQLGGP